MERIVLPPVQGYDAETQRVVGTVAAQLDDQLRRLKESVDGVPVAALEWQTEPGRNTAGMLLAHIAIAEAWWMNAGARGIADRDEARRRVNAVIGIDPADDGMPLEAGGAHPEALRNRTLRDYVALLERARIATHVVLRGWTDADLDETVVLRDHEVSRGWILYHLLEHFVAHYGQILWLLRMLRDRGLAPRPPQAQQE